MKIYLSGKITGTNDYMERFANAETRLMAMGYDVINPAKENAHFPDDTPWAVYMGESLKMLCNADGILLLDGWKQSRGANIEFDVAMKMKKHIYLEGELI